MSGLGSKVDRLAGAVEKMAQNRLPMSDDDFEDYVHEALAVWQGLGLSLDDYVAGLKFEDGGGIITAEQARAAWKAYLMTMEGKA